MDFMFNVHNMVYLFIYSVYIFCFMGQAMIEVLVILAGIIGSCFMALSIYLTIESFIERKDMKE